MSARRAPVTHFSEAGAERNEAQEQARRHVEECSVTISFPEGDYRNVVRSLETLDEQFRRDEVSVLLTPPEGFVRTFYGYERDLWS